MLNVPEEIKDILHQDSGYKNIRIHFPNGERTDICNDLIVKDSVSFKESLCSQDVLKFGLCEAPVFECETVGVGNIKGAMIEVSCEVECPASVEGSVFRTDLQKYVYPIPYGTFVVDESKRQADMNHRRIKAYNKVVYTLQKIGGTCKSKAEYKTSSWALFNQNLAAFFTDAFQSNIFGMTETEVETFGDWGQYTSGSSGAEGWWSYRSYEITPANSGEVYHVVVNNPYPLFNYEMCCSYARPTTSPQGGTRQMSYNPFKAWTPSTYVTTPTAPSCGEYIYPYMSMTTSETNSFFNATTSDPSVEGTGSVRIRVLYRYRQYDRNGQLVREYNYCDPDDIHIYVMSNSSSLMFPFVRELVQTGKYAVPNADEIDLRETLEAFAELMGVFCRVNRYSLEEAVNIKRQFGLTPSWYTYPSNSLYPQRVTGGKLLPEDYQSCWYDDTYTLKYGAIVCYFKTVEDSKVVDGVYTVYINGCNSNTDPNTYGVYEINGNAIINGKSASLVDGKVQTTDVTWTVEQITNICSVIASNLTGVQYMPVDFTGRGLPYVEAGDTFEILTASNDSITTIVLNRTISGEQVLVDSYQSV